MFNLKKNNYLKKLKDKLYVFKIKSVIVLLYF